MPPDLEIKILFCYSPEVLANSYNDIIELKADNQALCFVTQGVFKRNITTYNVSVTLVDSVKVNDLQVQDGIIYPSLKDEQIDDLSACTLAESIRDNPPQKFGTLPATLLQLKNNNKATVLVLQVLLYAQTSIILLDASSSCIGVQESRDNVVCIGRSVHTKGKQTYKIGKITLAHEFGHLMGCRHPYNANGGEGFSTTKSNNGHCILNASGRVIQGTIMSYAQNQILYYSNPNIFRYPAPYQNIPCGVIGESEAYKAVNNNIQKLAGIF